MHARREEAVVPVAEKLRSLPSIPGVGTADPDAETATREAEKRDPIEALMRKAKPLSDAILAAVRRSAK